MSRVIHVDNPGKRRNAARRSIAEILRYLSRKAQIDDEARDMSAALVFLLTCLLYTSQGRVGEQAVEHVGRQLQQAVEMCIRDRCRGDAFPPAPLLPRTPALTSGRS